MARGQGRMHKERKLVFFSMLGLIPDQKYIDTYVNRGKLLLDKHI